MRFSTVQKKYSEFNRTSIPPLDIINTISWNIPRSNFLSYRIINRLLVFVEQSEGKKMPFHGQEDICDGICMYGGLTF